jgi:hypothetical protein
MSHLAVLHMPDRGLEFETPKTRVRSGTLPSGITTKMDLFARHVAEGLSLANAYRAAFSTAKMKAKTIRDDASRLARHPGVRAAIEAHRAEIEARNRMSALERGDRIWEQIWGLIEGEGVPPVVKVKALDLAARMAGMFRVQGVERLQSVTQIETEIGERLHGLGKRIFD